ncbi:hypothetical protein D3C76_479200 [compost metagenome]
MIGRLNVQKRSLYVFSWQLLRVNLDFSTLETCKKSVAKCATHIEDAPNKTMALYRVVNLYAATVMGFNGQIQKRLKANDGRTDYEVKDLALRSQFIQAVREELSLWYASVDKTDESFRVNQMSRINELKEAQLKDLLMVHSDLRKRWLSANKRTYDIRRDELSEYLSMLEKELASRHARYKSAFTDKPKEEGVS